MPELIIAGVGVLLLRDRLGVTTGDGLVVVTAFAWAGLYLTSCWLVPLRVCWKGRYCTTRRSVVGDGRGNYRARNPCRWCRGGFRRRLGAKLIGRGA